MTIDGMAQVRRPSGGYSSPEHRRATNSILWLVSTSYSRNSAGSTSCRSNGVRGLVDRRSSSRITPSFNRGSRAYRANTSLPREG